MAGHGRDSARAKSGQRVLQDYDIFENNAASSWSPNFTSPRTNRCPPRKQDGISARNATKPSERPTESVKFCKQEIQQRSRGLNVLGVPRTTRNVRPPSMVKKKKNDTFLAKLREERRRQLSCGPLRQGFTREEVQNALNIFETIRLEIPKSSHQSAGALRKMRQQYPHFRDSKGNEGPVPGVEEGMKFDFRAQLSLLGIHHPLEKGIDWKDVKHYRKDGHSEILAISVVLSGKYEDDTDEGEKVIYTGEGGRDPTSGRQIANQILEKGNLALYNSYNRKNSIRFVRRDAYGVNGRPYIYDGLYKVEHWERVIGISGFDVFKFELVREAGQKPLDWSLRLPKPLRREEAEEDRIEDSEYEVEKILQKRTVRLGEKRRLEYFILWKDFPLEKATWEPAINLTHCHAKLEEFECS